MPTIQTNDITIHYQIQGTGQPLVLIAGLGQTLQFWQHLAIQLAKQYQVITFDNRGMGQSSINHQPYTVEQLAHDTWGLLTALQIKSPYLLGHSLGAAIAFETARQAPAQVGKLIMASGLYPGPQVVPARAATLKALLGGFGKIPNLVERGIRVATAPTFPVEQHQLFNQLLQARLNRQQSAQVVMRQSLAGTTYLATDKLKKPLPLPVCLIYGEQDQVTLPGNGQQIQTRLPQAEYHLIPKAGHLVPWEQPAQFLQVVQSFLR